MQADENAENNLRCRISPGRSEASPGKTAKYLVAPLGASVSVTIAPPGLGVNKLPVPRPPFGRPGLKTTAPNGA